MNKLNASIRPLLLSGIGLLAFVNHAAAVTLKVQPLSVYQVGTGSQVKIGHVVHASTNYNRLQAGGTYVATCADPVMSPTSGQRGISSENLLGGLQLAVTIPEWIPAYVNMPGYYSLPRGAEVACTYAFTGYAIEGGYMVGAGGISFQVGNGSQNEGGTQNFFMRVPGGTDPNDNSACIP
jgi:hypothetical protein